MENWILLISLAILLVGAFILRKLWLGALLAILFVLVFKGILLLHLNFAIPSFLSASIIAMELTLLLFGAYLFYKVLHSNNHFGSFTETTSSFSSKLFTLIILCVFMGGFMEGIAGFGIPAMLIAPLLITSGFKPLTSIVLPLAANTTAVTFGALGTPLKVGFGIDEVDLTVLFTLILNSLPALVLPFLLAFIYSRTEQTAVQWKKNWKMLLGSGVSFAVPYALTGWFSIEYPSVVAGSVGLLLFVSFFVSKKENPPLIFWLRIFYPYLLFVFFLLLAKYFLSDFNWIIADGTKALSLYQPGIIFLITSVVYLIIIKKDQLFSNLYIQSRETLFNTGKSIATIFLLVCLVQLIKNDLADVVNTYYLGLAQTTKLAINPFIGITGSFISGSATMSNLLLGDAIKTDMTAGTYLPLLLALLHTGSCIGNAISLQNIIMVKSVVNQPMIGYVQILKYNLLIVAAYVIIVISLSFLIINRDQLFPI